MMQQGGVSKATKTINLSEDIFAGMDFTLRGQRGAFYQLAKGLAQRYPKMWNTL